MDDFRSQGVLCPKPALGMDMNLPTTKFVMKAMRARLMVSRDLELRKITTEQN